MNSERIQNYAHLAEIVSGNAAVATLIIPVVEIRGNSDLIRDKNMQLPPVGTLILGKQPCQGAATIVDAELQR